MNILYINGWPVSDNLTVSTTLPSLRLLSNSNSISQVILVSPEISIDVSIHNIDKVKHEPICIKNKLPGPFSYLFEELKFRSHLYGIVKKHQISLIIARGAPAGGRAFWISSVSGIPFYTESFEPHSNYMLESGTWGKFDIRYLIQARWERQQISRASGLITVSHNYKEKLIDQGVPESKIAVVPCTVNGIEFEFDQLSGENVRNRLGIPPKSTVAIYVGKFGGLYYDREAFALFAQCFELIEDFQLILLSPTSQEDLSTYISAHENIDRKRIHTHHVSHASVSEYLDAADFAFVFAKPNASSMYNSSVKIGEYWAKGLPILIADSIGDDSEIVKKSGIGAIYDLNLQDNHHSLLKVLQIVSSQQRSKIVSLGNKYRNPRLIRDAYLELGILPDQTERVALI